MAKKHTVHKVLLHYEPSRKLDECHKQLRLLLPTLSEFHRMIAAAWWCGVQFNFPLRVANKVMHSVNHFSLLMEVECPSLDLENR
jgi:hypothetical protein